MADLTATSTVADLSAFLVRQQMALCEAGRADLADLAHIVIQPDGRVRFRCAVVPEGGSDPTVEKALGLDPKWGLGSPVTGAFGENE